jgi:hypothetical protein
MDSPACGPVDARDAQRRRVTRTTQSAAGPAVAWLVVAECGLCGSCSYSPGGAGSVRDCHRPKSAGLETIRPRSCRITQSVSELLLLPGRASVVTPGSRLEGV